MKIEFHTKDGLVAVKECCDIDEPFSVVMSPLWQTSPKFGQEVPEFMNYRRYEYRGQKNIDGMPIVHET